MEDIMYRSLIVLLVLVLVLTACAPAATPAPAAVPTKTAAATFSAPATAPSATQAPTYVPAEVHPPASGGVLNPPPLSPTAIGLQPNASADRWLTYRDQVYGLAFQYPPDWTFSITTTAPTGVLQRLSVARLNQSAGNAAEILIDVRKSSGDLLRWVKRELPKGSLLLDARFIEGGLSGLTAYNAKLGGMSAVWVFAPTHASTPSAAALHAADQHYFYQIAYQGDIPDNQDTRAIYLQLLATLTLSGTTASGLALPTTTFTATK
jgi:hypothetical protein